MEHMWCHKAWEEHINAQHWAHTAIVVEKLASKSSHQHPAVLWPLSRRRSTSHSWQSKSPPERRRNTSSSHVVSETSRNLLLHFELNSNKTEKLLHIQKNIGMLHTFSGWSWPWLNSILMPESISVLTSVSPKFFGKGDASNINIRAASENRVPPWWVFQIPRADVGQALDIKRPEIQGWQLRVFKRQVQQKISAVYIANYQPCPWIFLWKFFLRNVWFRGFSCAAMILKSSLTKLQNVNCKGLSMESSDPGGFSQLPCCHEAIHNKHVACTAAGKSSTNRLATLWKLHEQHKIIHTCHDPTYLASKRFRRPQAQVMTSKRLTED